MGLPVDTLLTILLLTYTSAVVTSFLIPKDEVIIDNHHPSYRSDNAYFSPTRDERATWAIYTNRLQDKNRQYKPEYQDSDIPSSFDEIYSRWLPLERSVRAAIDPFSKFENKRNQGLNTKGSFATRLLHTLSMKKRDLDSNSKDGNKLEENHETGKKCTCKLPSTLGRNDDIPLVQRASWLNVKKNDIHSGNTKEVAFANVQNTNNALTGEGRASWMSVKKSQKLNNNPKSINTRASWLQVKKTNSKQLIAPSDVMPSSPMIVENRANWLPVKKNAIIDGIQQRASWLPVKRGAYPINSAAINDENVHFKQFSPMAHNIHSRASWMNIKKSERPVAGNEGHTLTKRATWIPTRDLSNHLLYKRPTHTLSKTQHFINGRELVQNHYNPNFNNIPDREVYYLSAPLADEHHYYSSQNRLDRFSKRSEEVGYNFKHNLDDHKRAMWLPTRDLKHKEAHRFLNQRGNKLVRTLRDIDYF